MIIKSNEYIDTEGVNQSKVHEMRFKISPAEYRKILDCKKEFCVPEDAKIIRRLLRLSLYELQKIEPFRGLWVDGQGTK